MTMLHHGEGQNAQLFQFETTLRHFGHSLGAPLWRHVSARVRPQGRKMMEL